MEKGIKVNGGQALGKTVILRKVKSTPDSSLSVLENYIQISRESI